MFEFIKQWNNRKKIKHHEDGWVICPECSSAVFFAWYGWFFTYVNCMDCSFKWIEVNNEEPIKID